MSRREKRNEKKGISLVGFIVILIALVCAEGIYIVKLKGNDTTQNDSAETEKNTTSVISNVETPKNTDESVKNKVSLNNEIITSLGYDSTTMINSILDKVEAQANNSNIVRFVDGNATEEVVNSQEIQEKRADYKTVIVNNLDNEEIINSVKFEKGKLTCEYNLKNLLNLIGLESNSYAELDVNESNVGIYNFN